MTEFNWNQPLSCNLTSFVRDLDATAVPEVSQNSASTEEAKRDNVPEVKAKSAGLGDGYAVVVNRKDGTQDVVRYSSLEQSQNLAEVIRSNKLVSTVHVVSLSTLTTANLVPPEPKRRHTGHVNIYPKQGRRIMTTSHIYDTRDEADAAEKRDPGRIACIPVEFEEGEGL